MQANDPTIQQMKALAETAAARAYAPYSRFRVGAAVLAEDGELFSGCNVENASYSLTICAERNAVFHAIAAGKSQIDAVVIYAEDDRPAAPCGACRQVIAEFGPRAEVFSFAPSGECLHLTAEELLPHAFRLRPTADPDTTS